MLLNKNLKAFKRSENKLIRTDIVCISALIAVFPCISAIFDNPKIGLMPKIIISIIIIAIGPCLSKWHFSANDDFEKMIFLLTDSKYDIIIENAWIEIGKINFFDINETKIYFNSRKFTIDFCDILIKSIEEEKNGFKSDGTKKQRIIGRAAIMATVLMKNPVIKGKNERLYKIVCMIFGERKSYSEKNELNNILIVKAIYEYFKYYPKHIDINCLDTIEWQKEIKKVLDYEEIDKRAEYLYGLLEKNL